MSAPHLLLVDDSAAVLAYERAALGADYTLSTASDGAEGLDEATALRPDAIVLDLSMPKMTGEEMLARLQSEPLLRDIPVIIASSERERGEQCLARGAVAFLEKPLKAAELRRVIGQVLEDVRRRKRDGGAAILPVRIGAHLFALPLECVRAVAMHPATQRVSSGRSYLGEVFQLGERPVFVLDLARSFRSVHRTPLVERKLVVVACADLLVGLSVDEIHDPEEISYEQVFTREALAGQDARLAGRALRALVKTARGTLAVLEPGALFSRARLRRIASEIAAETRTDAAGGDR